VGNRCDAVKLALKLKGLTKRGSGTNLFLAFDRGSNPIVSRHSPSGVPFRTRRVAGVPRNNPWAADIASSLQMQNYCRKSAIFTCQNSHSRLKVYRTLGFVLEMRPFYAFHHDAFYPVSVSCNAFKSEMGCPFCTAAGGNKGACFCPMAADEDMPQLLLSKWML
jgi:hypothetical protein